MPTSRISHGELASLTKIVEAAEEIGEPVALSVAVKRNSKYVLAVYMDGEWTFNRKE